jgi:copper chaperone CopZ
MGLFSKSPEETMELKVQGMSCGHCEARLVAALKEIDGVKEASASHQAEQATVTLKSGAKVDKATLVAAVKATGYTPEE